MPPELDQMNMPMDLGSPAPSAEPQGFIPPGETDHEGAMAKADLYKLANYSLKLFKKIQDQDQLEGWVQAKITKAADYIASVYHYLEYEMKFSQYGHKLDNSDVLDESQRAVLKNKLLEAKAKMKELKKAQAEKVKEGLFGNSEADLAKKSPQLQALIALRKDPKYQTPEAKAALEARIKKQMDRVSLDKGEVVGADGKPIEVKEAKKAKKDYDGDGKVESNKDEVWGSRAKAAAKAGKPFNEELDKEGDTKKTATGELTKTKTGVVHKRTDFSDEEHGEAPSKVKEKSAAEKKADKDKDIKLPKHKGNTWGMKGGEKFGKKMEEAAGKCNHTPKDKKCPEHGLEECSKVYEEVKPSAGLTKKEKSAVVKKAKAGSDIGKPGKGFAKVEKAAKKSGAKDPKAVAAAAMWKNIKEEVAYLEEKKAATKAGKDYDGDGKVESGKNEYLGSRDKAIKAAKAKETVKESTDLNRLLEIKQRLVG